MTVLLVQMTFCSALMLKGAYKTLLLSGRLQFEMIQIYLVRTLTVKLYIDVYIYIHLDIYISRCTKTGANYLCQAMPRRTVLHTDR